MKERPIIFNGEMIRAILDGRKTQTRIPIKPQPTECGLVFRRAGVSEKLEDDFYAWEDDGLLLDEHSEDGGPCQRLCPFGVVGDRLWVRETYTTAERIWDGDSCRSFMVPGIVRGGSFFRYRADGEIDDARWRPSIHMPRWASRITLEITKVKVERVQEITEEDARAEGIIDGGCLNCGKPEPCGCSDPRPDARDAFVWLWDSIYAKRGFGWDSNPWVWVIEFRRVNP